ncbi:MAG: nucleotidyltransferase family protein [Terriglobia bacterium]
MSHESGAGTGRSRAASDHIRRPRRSRCRRLPVRLACARRCAPAHSDIDIAILPHGELPCGFFAGLADRIEESTIPYDVDLVDLREVGPSFREEVLRTGIKWRERLMPVLPVRSTFGCHGRV